MHTHNGFRFIVLAMEALAIAREKSCKIHKLRHISHYTKSIENICLYTSYIIMYVVCTY